MTLIEEGIFRIQEPAAIAFSGGRTSAYMLWRIVQAYGGKLPDDIVVAFANTGKERTETLDFVQQCGESFGVHINWLEYLPDDPGFQVVSHNSAARNGEPRLSTSSSSSMRGIAISVC